MDLMRRLLLAALTFLFCLPKGISAPLTIYCRDAFMATWGQALQSQYPDNIKLIKMSSAGLTTRLRLEGCKTTADLLLGIDTTQTREMESLGIVVPFAYDDYTTSLPTPWPQTALIPLGYGVLTILVHKNSSPMSTLEDLCQARARLIIPDPRTSTTGLEFLYWVQSHYGDQTPAFWQRLKPRILNYSKGLSSSFALFAGSSQLMTVAYSTSPLYAIRQHKRTDISALVMNGAPIQVYGMMVTKKGAEHPLMREIVAFLRSPDLQARIPQMDDLYPAAMPHKVSQPLQLPPLPAHLLPPPFLTPHEKETLIQQWLKFS